MGHRIWNLLSIPIRYKMITDSIYQLDIPTIFTEERSEQTPKLSVLLFDFTVFRNKVYYFRSNYQSPDYFNFCENVSDLQTLLESIIQQLKSQVGDFNNIPNRTLSNSLELSLISNQVKANAEKEGIAMILVGLKNLIHTNNKAVIESEELEEYYMKSLLLSFKKELEKMQWIFCMFSKY